MAGKLYFNKEHLWVRVEGNRGTIGISDHAQEELGDVLLVETSSVHQKVKQSNSFGQIESAKAVSDLISPVSGTIIEVNTALSDEPELINEDPYGRGWIIKVILDNPKELDELLEEDAYRRYIQEEYS
ncbi:MAG: glycine cleavage system protein GcvH [bacterium]|nr:glycine cleavage system protein GcvH [bacterium]